MLEKIEVERDVDEAVKELRDDLDNTDTRGDHLDEEVPLSGDARVPDRLLQPDVGCSTRSTTMPRA